MKRIFPGTHIRLIPIRTSKTTSVVMAAHLCEHIWIYIVAAFVSQGAFFDLDPENSWYTGLI